MTRVRVVSLRSFDRLIADLSPKAYRAWARSIEWAIVLGTDGFLAADDIKAIGPTPAAHKELLQRGVWKVDEDGRTFVAELREGPVVAEVEGSDVEQLSPGAKRQREWRARKRNTEASQRDAARRLRDADSETPGDASETSQRDADSPTPPPISSPSGSSLLFPESSLATSSDPKDLTGSARVPRRKPKVPIPDAWAPKQRHIEKAIERRLNLDDETQRFRNDALKKDQRWADWDRAFDNWLISPFAKPSNANGERTKAGQFTESLLQRAAMLRSQGQ